MFEVVEYYRRLSVHNLQNAQSKKHLLVLVLRQ